MDNRTALESQLTRFITGLEEVSSFWDGKTSGAIEDSAHIASELIELAQPLRDKLREIAANEAFVPPQS